MSFAVVALRWLLKTLANPLGTIRLSEEELIAAFLAALTLFQT
jgi:hypothetical protein